MSVYTDVAAADAAAIQSLLGEIKQLRSRNMGKQIIVSVDGNIYETEHARVLSQDEINDRRAKLTADLNQLNAATNNPPASNPAPAHQVTEQPGTPAAAELPADPSPQFIPQAIVGNEVTPPPAPAADQVAPAPPVLG